MPTWRPLLLAVSLLASALVLVPSGAATALTVNGDGWYLGRYIVSVAENQPLAATASGGTPPYSFAWDIDGDGTYETPGQAPFAHLSVGFHTVYVRVTDSASLTAVDSAVVEVRAGDAILRMRCNTSAPGEQIAMELSASQGSCWMHSGHQTYYTGGTTYSLRAVNGYVSAVEQMFSPPIETAPTPGKTPIHVDVSTDGIAWTDAGIAEYTLLVERQAFYFEFTGAGQQFRYIRAHEPLSAAQGLSGYLDYSLLDVEADVAGTASATAAPGTRDLSCDKDILEDFVALHPCWFGGIDRYDAASYFHTYPLADGAKLDRISGSFTLAPWRLDDWRDGGGSATATLAYVQTSVDGIAWTDRATVGATYGQSASFDLTLPHVDAKFVRLFPQYHARFAQLQTFAANHHARGYFLASNVHVEGDV